MIFSSLPFAMKRVKNLRGNPPSLYKEACLMESFALSCLANIVAGLIVAWVVHKWINH